MGNSLGRMMAGGGGARPAGDFYATPADVTIALAKALKEHFGWKPAVIWEPAAGDGSMARVLEEQFYCSIFATDIEPSGSYRVAIRDFVLEGGFGRCSWPIITNPPFALAEPFIRRALSLSNQVAMLLKATFWHAASRQQLFQLHRPAAILPLTWRPDFMGLGAPTMEFAWNVWESPCSTSTEYLPLARPASRPIEIGELPDDCFG